MMEAEYANVFGTSDGGLTWTHSDTLHSMTIIKIHFLDQYMGWAAGISFFSSSDKPNIFFTADGGQSWEPQYGSDEELIITDLFFTNADNGWALGWSGAIYKYNPL